MPKNYIHKLYNQWMKDNIHRFNHKPIITKQRKQGYELTFEGTSPHIQGWISKSGLSVTVDFEYFMVDFLFDMDIIVISTYEGEYYCDWCQSAYVDGSEKSKPARYKSRKELWIEHSFKPFLEWTNKFFIPSNRLCISEDTGGHHYAAVIRTKKQAEEGNYAHVFPVTVDGDYKIYK